MTVNFATKVSTSGTVTATALNVETQVYSIAPQSGAQVVEGYVDTSAMVGGDTATITEYVGLSGSQSYKILNQNVLAGSQVAPVVRFPAKILDQSVQGTVGDVGYRVTVNQSGTATVSGTVVRPYTFSFTDLVMTS